jgi:hypothetical protein
MASRIAKSIAKDVSHALFTSKLTALTQSHLWDCTHILSAWVNLISRGLNLSRAQYFKILQLETPGKI